VQVAFFGFSSVVLVSARFYGEGKVWNLIVWWFVGSFKCLIQITAAASPPLTCGKLAHATEIIETTKKPDAKAKVEILKMIVL
jgi:hypothetical protein